MKVQVGVGAGAVLALAGIGAAGFLIWRALQGWGEKKRALADLWAAGEQKVQAFTAAAADPYSVEGFLAYGGGLNPVARVAVPAVKLYGDVQREGSLGGWVRAVTSDDDERIRDMLQGTTAQNAALADVARVQAASTGGATGSW